MTREPLRQDELEFFEGARGRLEAIAYRLLGSAAEAEDAAQETFLRWEAADRDGIRVPEAWLTRVLTNLCLTQLRSARVRREVYVGQWLPEPVLEGDPMLGPAETAEQRDSVSTAMLVLMERLTPHERAVYVLREAFAFPHAEIAGMLGITEASCQQTLHRAKQHLATARARTDVDPATAREVVEEFLAAATSGRTEPLIRLLTGDVMGVGDGGGKFPVRPKPFFGAAVVAQFLRGVFRPADARRPLVGARAVVGGSPDIYAWTANGDPALVFTVGDRIVGILTLGATTEGIAAVFTQANPDKLGRAGRRWAASDHGEPLLSRW
ncbi:RNA polymerase sigma factor SigJ [Myceligenerans xiligouense]|uniref:RNA polymerase sigma-70 factor (ECF subfamily) n=1 Tax=Myceligenerans xiligouense TaxID=253184 RepID=A0A3N4Z5D8_9MICO|nr:RNA polymerase sigma factor SigJ [Myceligenerans xiligouense]RPF20432.1 RNA polymerase sigma-70 factor (ECF subfamily) [Myceligenerans xiligouense]